jgi:hypothetical protein
MSKEPTEQHRSHQSERSMVVVWADYRSKFSISHKSYAATLTWHSGDIISLVVNDTQRSLFRCPVTEIKSFRYSPDGAKLSLRNGTIFYLGLRTLQSEWRSKWDSLNFTDNSLPEGVVVDRNVPPREDRQWWMSSFQERGVKVIRFAPPTLVIPGIIFTIMVLLIAYLTGYLDQP